MSDGVMTWHIRDFAPDDPEAALRLDAASAMPPGIPTVPA
jgi:hypothetical protein